MDNMIELSGEQFASIKQQVMDQLHPSLMTQLKSHLSPATLMRVNSFLSTVEAYTPEAIQTLLASSSKFDIAGRLGVSPLTLCVASIAFNPIFWNIAARTEYNTRLLTKLALGKPYLGCYILAITIFSLGILRDHLYYQVLSDARYPVSTAITTFGSKVHVAGLSLMPHQLAGAALVAVGNILVVSSMWALGVTGTYLGDYFGILMDHRVTSFPFNVTHNPMYHGSFLSFLGTALWFGKPVGVALSAEVLVMYLLALRFEEPYTGAIYEKREKQRAKRGGGGGSGKKNK